jgi:hypothetical protein
MRPRPKPDVAEDKTKGSTGVTRQVGHARYAFRGECRRLVPMQ